MKHMGTHELYRKFVSAVPGTKKVVDLSWQGNLSKAAKQLVRAIELTVYSKDHDGTLKTGLRFRKIAEEVCEYTNVQDELDIVKELLKEDKAEQEQEKKEHAEEQQKRDAERTENSAGANASADAAGDEEATVETSAKLMAHRAVRAHAVLHAEQKSEQKVADAIKATPVYGLSGGENPGFTAVFWDLKMSGEAKTQPNVRIASFRSDVYEKLVNGALKAFSVDPDNPSIQSDAIWFLFDGFKAGLESELMRPFKTDGGKKMNANKRVVYVHIDPVSMNDRRREEWDADHKNVVEYMYVLTADRLDIPEKAMPGFMGITNKMNLLGPVRWDRTEAKETWKLSFKDKKDLYGLARMGVGGPGIENQGPKKTPRTDDRVEATFFASHPTSLFQSILKAYNIKACVNLSGGDGAIELACIDKEIPCVSFCHTTTHVEKLYEWLESRVFDFMQTPGTRMHNKKLVEYVRKQQGEKEEAEDWDPTCKPPGGLHLRSEFCPPHCLGCRLGGQVWAIGGL